MNDRIEKGLKIDAFREAVRSNQEALGSRAHVFHAGAAFLGGQGSGDGPNTEAGKSFAKTFRDVFCRSNEAAEDDGICSLSHERLQNIDHGD